MLARVHGDKTGMEVSITFFAYQMVEEYPFLQRSQWVDVLHVGCSPGTEPTIRSISSCDNFTNGSISGVIASQTGRNQVGRNLR